VAATGKSLQRRLIEGSPERFDFVLAEHLHKHVHDIRELPNSEVMEWLGYLQYKAEVEDFELNEGEGRRRMTVRRVLVRH
jgi:hypothetical protein